MRQHRFKLLYAINTNCDSPNGYTRMSKKISECKLSRKKRRGKTTVEKGRQ